ncbi:MAG: phosphate propanoyltransferase [Parasporobacterium sp.]|nr:phosphate propanoyltransferase [Parasporobacterium sp.]
MLRLVLTELAAEGFRYAPVGVSVKHVHLSERDVQILFGPGYKLHPLRELVQPGQYAAEEQVTLKGPKGELHNVRVIGPARSSTQIELGITDALNIGMKNIPVRLSGDLEGTPGIVIEGPAGKTEVRSGCIAAARHLHLSSEQARVFGLHDGMSVSVRFGGQRSCILENVICRVGKGHELEFHADTDEANACGLKNKDLVEILIPGQDRCSDDDERTFDPVRVAERVIRRIKGIASGNDSIMTTGNAHTVIGSRKKPADELLELVTERDINDAIEKGESSVYCTRRALVTPAAYDRALAFGIDIVRSDDNNVSVRAVPESGREVLELVTAGDLNTAFRDDRKEIYCTADAIITPSAKERIEETGIRVVRVQEGTVCR